MEDFLISQRRHVCCLLKIIQGYPDWGGINIASILRDRDGEFQIMDLEKYFNKNGIDHTFYALRTLKKG